MYLSTLIRLTAAAAIAMCAAAVQPLPYGTDAQPAKQAGRAAGCLTPSDPSAAPDAAIAAESN